MRITIIVTLLVIYCLQVRAEDEAIARASEPESRGILSTLGGGMHDKLRKFVTTVKDILLGHHKKIGGFHYRLKDCFEKIIALEKKLLGLKGESASCPDISLLVEKVKDKLYANDYAANSNDVSSMVHYLSRHIGSLESQLQQESKYLKLAYDHLNYLRTYVPAHRPDHMPHYPPPPAYQAKPLQVNPSIKMRDGDTNNPHNSRNHH